MLNIVKNLLCSIGIHFYGKMKFLKVQSKNKEYTVYCCQNCGDSYIGH
jgi:predicted nucleic-acid-binding Zn-ribbon protein